MVEKINYPESNAPLSRFLTFITLRKFDQISKCPWAPLIGSGEAVWCKKLSLKIFFWFSSCHKAKESASDFNYYCRGLDFCYIFIFLPPYFISIKKIIIFFIVGSFISM